MAELATAGAENIRVRNLAVDLTNRLPQKDFRGEACVLLEYVRDRIRYVRDIRDVETLHTVDAILDIGAGDCDDKAILLAALLLSIGHSPQFIAVAFQPDKYSHVWVRDFIRGKWIDLEATEPIECGNRIPHTGAVSHLTLTL